MVRSKKTFHIIYFLSFLIYLAHALTIYIQSSYLRQFAPVRLVGIYITIATLVNILAIFLFPQFIKKYTNYRVMLALTMLYVFNIFLLIISKNPLTILPFFTIYFVILSLLGINLDVFLEDITENKKTGKIRTLYLTVVNAAILFGPLFTGYILGDSENYSLLFLLSAILIFFVFLFLAFFRPYLNDHFRYNRRHIIELLDILKNNRNMFHIFIQSFILRFFYGIMVFYTPLYLHTSFNFSWKTIGLIFTFMLLPFVLLQLPAGNLADKYLGEKELLIAGMIIMALSTGGITFITSHSAVVWAIILFITRIGAALVESMQEVYFFKIIKREDVDIINLFRDLTPAGWLAASGVSVIVLKFLPIQYIFFILAIAILLTLYSTFRLKDTK